MRTAITARMVFNQYIDMYNDIQFNSAFTCLYITLHTHVLSGYTDIHVYIIIPSSYIYKHVAKVTIYTQKYNIIRCMKILFVERGL